MYELFVDELSDEEKERHYAFHKRVCGVWGIDARRACRRRLSEFMQYCSQMWHSDRLVVTPAGRRARRVSAAPAAVGARSRHQHVRAAHRLSAADADGARLRTGRSALRRQECHVVDQVAVVLGDVRRALESRASLYRSVPLSVRQFTGAAERLARKSGEPMRWYSRVAARIGTWFVHSVLSARERSVDMQTKDQETNMNDITQATTCFIRRCRSCQCWSAPCPS
jgi:hypothetical protein